MQATEDIELLREYAQSNSEGAFATLVQRHINLVYAAALRQVRDPQLAEEVTQAVFLVLARKAHAFGKETVISGWLYRTARFTAFDALRSQRRRQDREQQAAQMDTTPPDANWEQIAPLLDEAMAALGEKDRNAIVLRFFQEKPLREVGTALGIDADTAQKRIARALERLRQFFLKRGVAVSAMAMASLLSASAAQAAPAGLASVIAAAAALKTTTTLAASTTTLIEGTLKIMAWTKLKTTVIAGAALLFAAGTATVTVNQIYPLFDHAQPWQLASISSESLRKAPCRLLILPTVSAQRRAEVGQGGRVAMGDGRSLGLNQSVASMLAFAYGADSTHRMVIDTPLPDGMFDFLCNLELGNQAALQLTLKKQFSVLGRKETRDTDVLVIKVKQTPAPGLQPSTVSGGGMSAGGGQISIQGQPLSSLLQNLEGWFGMPVVDQTGLEGRYDIEFMYDQTAREHPDPAALKQALLEQLGLEAVPGREPIEMLIVQKAP